MADDRRRASGEDRRRSSVDPDAMGKARRPRKPTKERWLLTRKTWKYMADAGRRLIPEGALNRPEDVPKIEAYFQEVCQKEPKFLLWRKSSYPGAVGFRPHRRRTRTKGGSYRQASSADEAEEATPPKKQVGNLIITQTSGGRFDVSKLKKDFLEASSSKDPKAALKNSGAPAEDPDQKELIDMIQKYLNVQDKPPPPPGQPGFNYQDLIDKLQQHLALVFGKQNERERRSTGTRISSSQHEGDPVQRSLLDTLSRYYSRSPNRDHIIQDLLTDRKLLKKLYYDLRQTKGFRGSRTNLSSSSSTGMMPQWRTSLHQNRRDEDYEEENDEDYNEVQWDRSRSGRGIGSPPPLVEVQGEMGDRFSESGIQTDPILEITLRALRSEAVERKRQKLLDEEEALKEIAKPDDKKSPRRRSSVDHDDVSQSVSDTIKRYLRMARKKSVDADKADRFKRINYDKNLRNIKPRGEISKPGDDDGLHKGCQTDEEWLDTFDGAEAATPDKGSGSFFSHLLHGRDKQQAGSAPVTVSSSPTGGGSMQKSRSSSSVVQHVSRKIWRTRSKSRGPPLQPSTWVPQGSCTWTDGTGGHHVVLGGAPLQSLPEAERRAVRQAALARLRQLNLGVPVDIPDESAASATKPKRRAYLLKRKALTTGFLTKDGEKEKDSAGGLVFGIPLSQCADASRRDGALRRESARGSRSSFSSLLDRVGDESGSCESLASRDRLASSESELEAPEDLCPRGAARVPALVGGCLEHLRRHGLRTLGLFRVSASKKRVRQLREEWDCGKEGPLEVDTCPHDVATLLKEFLRDLPDPLLCRDLYQAFLQTQKIRNRRLQQEALQLLVLLLPSAHQDTLKALLFFLGEVADNCDDKQEPSGEYVTGNKMDTNNLATVFAPNILHCIKPGSAGKEMSAERAEDRIDVINVIRSLIELRDNMFTADAELRHEACLQLATTQPAVLDALLGRLLATTMRNNELMEGGQSGGADSDSQGSPPSQRRVWSREECLHQTAAMGGPNVGMTFRQRERERGGREARSSSKKRWREEQRQDSSSGSLSSTMTIITSRLRGSQGLHQDDQNAGVVYSSSKYSSGKGRSDSLDSSDTNDGYGHRRRSSSSEAPVITASLRLPLSLALDDPDIPYIEESGAGGQPTVPPRRRQRSISGSDSSIASQPITGTLSLSHVGSSNPAGYDSAVGSSATLSSPPRNLTPSSSSAGDGGLFSSPPSWASTPPTSPTSPPNDYEQFTARMSLPGKPSTQKQQKDAPILQKVTLTSTGEIQQKQMEMYKREISYEMQSNIGQKPTTKVVELPKSHSASSVSTVTSPGQRRVDFTGSSPSKHQEREAKYTPSISSIGGAVLRSKTADFERLLHLSKPESPKPIPKVETISQQAIDEKKKYTKRRYTDSRHQTRHIPDAETLDNTKVSDIVSATTPSGRPTPVYKRRELISSVQTKNK